MSPLGQGRQGLHSFEPHLPLLLYIPHFPLKNLECFPPSQSEGRVRRPPAHAALPDPRATPAVAAAPKPPARVRPSSQDASPGFLVFDVVLISSRLIFFVAVVVFIFLPYLTLWFSKDFLGGGQSVFMWYCILIPVVCLVAVR